MKTFFTVLLLSSAAFADQFTGTPSDYKHEKFQNCEKPDCIYVLCEQGEIVDFKGFLPGLGCTKAMRKDKNGKFIFEYYEIGIKELATEPKEVGGERKNNMGFLIRVR